MQRQRQRQQLAFRGLPGRCRIAGSPQVRPCRLGRGIHAADTPQSDTARPRHIPATAGGCRPWSTHWSDIEWNSGGQIRFPKESGSDTKRRPSSSRETVEGGVGPVAGVSAAWMPRPSPGGHFRDGFTASPATGPTPPSLRKPAFDVDVALASAGAGRSPAERTPYLNRPFCARSQPSVRLDRSAAAVRFPPGPPATRVRPLRPPPLRRRSSRIPAGASCRLHPTSRSAVHGNAPSQPITLICPRLSVRTGVSCTWSNLNVF